MQVVELGLVNSGIEAIEVVQTQLNTIEVLVIELTELEV